MMNRITRLTLALTFALTGVLTSAPAQALTLPAAVATDAALMECVLYPGVNTYPAGGVGADCKFRNNKIGNQDFSVIRYDDATAAVAYWQGQLDADQWFARDGHVIILPMGSWQVGTPYVQRWADYAAATTGGVLKHG